MEIVVILWAINGVNPPTPVGIYTTQGVCEQMLEQHYKVFRNYRQGLVCVQSTPLIFGLPFLRGVYQDGN